jgi:hypothetical protein
MPPSNTPFNFTTLDQTVLLLFAGARPQPPATAAAMACTQQIICFQPTKLLSNVCCCLQVLDLSHQALLQQPGALQPLSALRQLSCLSIRLSDSAEHLPYSSWRSLAALTGVRELDVSGCALCWLDDEIGYSSCCHTDGSEGCSGDTTFDVTCHSSCGCRCNRGDGGSDRIYGRPLQQTADAAAAAAAAEQMELMVAPLQLLRGLQQLQRLVLADWQVAPTAAGKGSMRCVV